MKPITNTKRPTMLLAVRLYPKRGILVFQECPMPMHDFVSGPSLRDLEAQWNGKLSFTTSIPCANQHSIDPRKKTSCTHD